MLSLFTSAPTTPISIPLTPNVIEHLTPQDDGSDCWKGLSPDMLDLCDAVNAASEREPEVTAMQVPEYAKQERWD